MGAVLVVGTWGRLRPGHQQPVAGTTRIECCAAEPASVRLKLAKLHPSWLVISPFPDEVTVQYLVMMSWQMYPDLRLAIRATPSEFDSCERWIRRGCQVVMNSQSSIDKMLAILAVAAEHDVIVVDRLFYLEGIKSHHPGFLPALTTRQKEVLDLLRRGLTNSEIASVLNVSRNTVEFHVGHLLFQLGVRNRMEAVERARHLGLI